jgi:hypothetical protein
MVPSIGGGRLLLLRRQRYGYAADDGDALRSLLVT